MTENSTEPEVDVVEGPSGPTDEPPTVPDGTVEPETFDREYVQKLRDEAAGHRVKAKRADGLAAALVTAQAALTGRMADPTDLPYDEELLDDDGVPDSAKVLAAVEEAAGPQAAPRSPPTPRRRRAGSPPRAAGGRARGAASSRCVTACPVRKRPRSSPSAWLRGRLRGSRGRCRRKPSD